MTREAQDLLERALKLSLSERATLAKRLFQSVEAADDANPSEVDKAWGKEIERRVREIDEGRVKGIPHEQVMAHVREKLARARKRRKT